jgi:hypothetical protein
METETFNLQFHFSKFEIRNYETSEYITKGRKDVLTNFNVKSEMAFDLEKELFHVMLTVDCSYTDESGKPKDFCIFETFSEFQLKGTHDAIEKQEDGSFVFKSSTILAAFYGISFSTTRGALATKAVGTVLEEQLLPIVDPKEMVQPNLKFKLGKPSL